ncbi:MAG: adaptor protein MecA [Clostridia bacterium]|nr:adaptor protein MecA [Clostridia bacterium]
MELIRISDCKLKVMLTQADIERLHFDPESDSSEDLHRSFRSLLLEIQRRSGFTADGKELSIQYFPSREGGCEMFISNLREKEPKSNSASSLAPCEITGFRKEYVFRFCEMNLLLTACKRLLQIGYAGDSEAYVDEGEQWFLILSLISSHPFEMPEELFFLSEYGRQESATDAKIYLAEHGRRLCPDSAVPILAKYI